MPRLKRAAGRVTRKANPRPATSGNPDAVNLTLRIDLGAAGPLGPGKIRLLELIGDTGSISAAGRAMGMSYRQAWLLIDSLNSLFREPVTETLAGGVRGGGADLTPFGRTLIQTYRDIEATAGKSVATELVSLAKFVGSDKTPRAAKSGSRKPRS